ncbi:pitrilysin family protein [Sphingomicrobium sp. XHP0239]|uniref:M16 family metallopeptidase n=1 Tax=Sphingomicrobium maritimum TaxID=3133972 RepID=UPI0031CCBE75
MKSLLAAVSAATMAVAMPVTAVAQDAQVDLDVPRIDYEEWTLDNGLRVIAVHDESTPNVMTSMWYDIGSKLDPEGRSGFAHLFEHLLSRKTLNIPYNEISKMVANIGGTRNASNGADRTNYYEIVPAEYLERLLWTHAERMDRPVIDQDVFDIERDVVKEELRQRVLAPPYGRFQRFVLPENVYTNLPQRRPGIGSIEDLDSATLEDAHNFHAAYYGPDTATLIVAGNYDPAELRQLVDKYFAEIPARPNPIPLEITAEEAPIVPRTVTGSGPNVPLPVFGRAYLLPPVTDPTVAHMDLIAAILSRGENNRLDKALVKTGLSVGASAYAADSEERGAFYISATQASDATEPELTAAMDREIARLIADGVTEEELFEAKNEILASALSQRELFSSRAFTIGEALVQTGDPSFPDVYLDRIKAATTADLLAAARTYLAPSGELRLRYVNGEGDPSTWTNPAPMPEFRALPTASRQQYDAVLPEGERMEWPAPGEAPDYALPDIVEDELSNGMDLVTIDTGDTPIATMTLVVRTGSIVDSRDKAGLADMATALAEKGTSNASADQVAASLERLGANFSANAGLEGTRFSVTAPAGSFAEASAILARIVRDASFPQDEFDLLQSQTLDGLKVAFNDPGNIAGLLIRPVLFGEAAYGNVSGGTPTTVAALTRADVAQYARTYWQPSLSSIVVSGGVDTAEAKRVAEAAFGDWQDSGTVTLPTSLAGDPMPARTLVVDLPGTGQAAVYAVARGVTDEDPAYYPSILANAELGGSSTARLFEEIRVKRALSYGSYSGLSDYAESGLFTASAQTKNESAAEVAQILLAEIARIGREPLVDDVVEQRRTLLKGSFQRGIERSAGIGGAVASGLLEGKTPAEVLAYPERLDAVAAADTAQIGSFLTPNTVSIIIVGDADLFLDDLRAIRDDVEVIAAADLDLGAIGTMGGSE